MDFDTFFKDGGFVMGGAALALLIQAAMRVYTSRNQRTTLEPIPLRVAPELPPRTEAECNRLRDQDRDARTEIFLRLNSLDKSMADIGAKVDILLKMMGGGK